MENIIYQATVKDQTNDTIETYIGLTGDNFKKRLANHKKSFKHEAYRHETCLSSHVWELKEKNHEYDITWKLIDKGTQYQPSTDRCNLCNKEKFHIIYNPETATLNSRNELWGMCRHKRNLLICNYKARKVKTTNPS